MPQGKPVVLTPFRGISATTTERTRKLDLETPNASQSKARQQKNSMGTPTISCMQTLSKQCFKVCSGSFFLANRRGVEEVTDVSVLEFVSRAVHFGKLSKPKENFKLLPASSLYKSLDLIILWWLENGVRCKQLCFGTPDLLRWTWASLRASGTVATVNQGSCDFEAPTRPKSWSYLFTRSPRVKR